MADSVDRVFVHALNTVKKLPRSGASKPSPEDRLKLYGLYKQSMEGDVDGVLPRPAGTSDEEVMEARKWDAWNAQRGLSKTEAKRRYITTVIEAMNRYALTTPDARELISELEFVWDQIKTNVSSSNSSSTPNKMGSQVPAVVRPGSSSMSQHQNRSAAGLQILPPMSPTEEAEFATLPPIGMGVQTEDEADDDEDEDEHYETMDEFDENGLPKVAVISDPTAGHNLGSGAGESAPQSLHTQPPFLDRIRAPASSQHSHPLSQTSFARGMRKVTASVPAASQHNGGSPNPHYSRWKHRVEAALTKMTAEVAAMREQLEAARSNGNIHISRTRINWLRRWFTWGAWLIVKHVCVDALLLGVLVLWMRRRGDRRLEGVLNLLLGFLGDRLRLRSPDGGSDKRTFVVA